MLIGKFYSKMSFLIDHILKKDSKDVIINQSYNYMYKARSILDQTSLNTNLEKTQLSPYFRCLHEYQFPLYESYYSQYCFPGDFGSLRHCCDHFNKGKWNLHACILWVHLHQARTLSHGLHCGLWRAVC